MPSPRAGCEGLLEPRATAVAGGSSGREIGDVTSAERVRLRTRPQRVSIYLPDAYHLISLAPAIQAPSIVYAKYLKFDTATFATRLCCYGLAARYHDHSAPRDIDAIASK